MTSDSKILTDNFITLKFFNYVFFVASWFPSKLDIDDHHVSLSTSVWMQKCVLMKDFQIFRVLDYLSLLQFTMIEESSSNFRNGTFLLVIQFYHCRCHQPLFSWSFDFKSHFLAVYLTSTKPMSLVYQFLEVGSNVRSRRDDNDQDEEWVQMKFQVSLKDESSVTCL